MDEKDKDMLLSMALFLVLCGIAVIATSLLDLNPEDLAGDGPTPGPA